MDHLIKPKKEYKETGDSWYICQNKLHKAYFQHDMAYGDFENLPRRTTSDKVWRDKACNFAKSRKYGPYQSGRTSMV